MNKITQNQIMLAIHEIVEDKQAPTRRGYDEKIQQMTGIHQILRLSDNLDSEAGIALQNAIMEITKTRTELFRNSIEDKVFGNAKGTERLLNDLFPNQAFKEEKERVDQVEERLIEEKIFIRNAKKRMDESDKEIIEHYVNLYQCTGAC